MSGALSGIRPALRVADLRIAIGGRALVDDVSFEVAPGECVALVGESGAGKSLTVRALLGLSPVGAAVSAATLDVGGVDARALPDRAWRALRGTRVALVSQDALVSLDPLRRIGAEVAEPLEIHARLTRAERSARVQELLTDVAMPDPLRRARQRPHELSGGLRQRALIASALAGDPALLIADEPTTALDATVQARVLALLRRITDAGTAVVLVSHDMAAVRRIADRVVVLRGGRVVEQGTAAQLLAAPREDYTRELVRAAAPTPRALDGDDAEVLATVTGLRKRFDRPVLRDVAFSLRHGRTLGIVGESGSGKTTLARILIGVEHADDGVIAWAGGTRPRIQLVHQNPLGAFDPRWTIGRSLREALAAGGVPRTMRRERVAALLREVDLDPGLAARRPAELSGGQRQRAAIARALAADPEVLVLDEPVSALDATVRARILALLDRLQRERGLTMVLISHDLAVVAAAAEDVLVMQDGAIVEQGPSAAVLRDPQHPFTRELVAASGLD
ncbi:ATP-binding cassette domain-containing protein [Microbacterium azadirachtae]|uniref:ATP-binding cassette domain-containing protein n=1 Tax=Microbacterium azadirachtae TaxID=582680 RepID=UPI000885C9FD|nr:ABC transporter ATP-binding protein [Microbacterium azadirachtae]SDL17625.1 peptide/nickel transport system ATP-binding protein [Microbacterium azadirachtae]SEF47774.1 peptide/nickel transport system ATP-binding protein [Microbacterium azadirachtae]SEF47798.1 peptide/nickel transport system ATP-binding protein [Microbacterium azadirachtae]